MRALDLRILHSERHELGSAVQAAVAALACVQTLLLVFRRCGFAPGIYAAACNLHTLDPKRT